MTFYLYILYSKKLNKYYVGATQNIQKRLVSHLSNHRGFTVRAKDWVVVYQETFQSKEAAYAREKQIKSWKSRKMILRLILENDN